MKANEINHALLSACIKAESALRHWAMNGGDFSALLDGNTEESHAMKIAEELKAVILQAKVAMSANTMPDAQRRTT